MFKKYLEKIDGIGKNKVAYYFKLKLKKSPKLKILHLSDLHFNKDEKKKIAIAEYDKYLKNQKFDLILISGDIVDFNITEFTKEYVDFLKNLKAKKGKYYVFGNHDYYTKRTDKIEQKMKKAGFVNLNNTEKNLNKIKLIGIDDYNYGEKRDWTFTKDKFTIGMCHNLDSVDNFSNFDLVLSGHLHEGEINLGIIDGVTKLFLRSGYKNKNKQRKGFKWFGNCLSFIHPGMHTCNPLKRRIFTKKEGIVIFELE